MPEPLELREIEKLFDLLLYFEGYKSEEGEQADPGKLTKKNFTRTQIILQSIAIFSQKGITDTTVQDLLEASQVSRRTFYKYFKDKYDVLENIYRLSINMFSKRFGDRLQQSRSLEELVDNTVSSYFSYHGAMGSMIRIMHEDAYRDGSPLQSRRIHDRNTFSQNFKEKAVALGYFNKNMMVFYSAFWILENASMYLLSETQCKEQDIDRVQEEVKSALRALLAI